MWEWRNDPDTRESSFNTAYIPYEDHQHWFSKKIRDSATSIFVVVDHWGSDVGYVRFDIYGDEAEISISLNKSDRGKGHGTTAIRIGSDLILTTTAAKRIISRVKNTNAASVVSFQQAGFITRRIIAIGDTKASELVYEGTHKDINPGEPSNRESTKN